MDLSASKLSLLQDCQYWARPDVTGPKDVAGKPARKGSATHQVAEALVAKLPVPTAEELAATHDISVDEGHLAIMQGQALFAWVKEAFAMEFPSALN